MLNRWWDGYQGEETVLMDDLDETWHDGCKSLPHLLKRWSDYYAVKGEVKNSHINPRHHRFIVTSQYSITELFGNRQAQPGNRPESGVGDMSGDPTFQPNKVTEALERRFKVIDLDKTLIPPETMKEMIARAKTRKAEKDKLLSKSLALISEGSLSNGSCISDGDGGDRGGDVKGLSKSISITHSRRSRSGSSETVVEISYEKKKKERSPPPSEPALLADGNLDPRPLSSEEFRINLERRSVPAKKVKK